MLRRLLASIGRGSGSSDGTRRVLNVGGGSRQIPLPGHYQGWKHVLLDVNPAAGVDIALDARKLRRLAAASFDAVYCSHNLEHYHAHEIPQVLEGFVHVLKPQGFVELRVPDIAAVMRETVRRGLDLEDALYVSPAGPVSVRDVLYGFGAEIGRGNEYYAHKTGFTDRSLRRFLGGAGFVHVYALAEIGGFELRLAGFRARPGAVERELLKLGAEAA